LTLQGIDFSMPNTLRAEELLSWKTSQIPTGYMQR